MNSRLISTVALAGVAAATWAVWSMPEAKDGGVAGRLNYPQFMFALSTTAAALSVMAVVLPSAANRRTRIFRVLAVWLGVGLPLAILEIGAWAWPTRHLMDSPWYLSTGRAMVAARDLPYLRPPHFTWTGYVRGDLAIADGSPDPDARVVTFATDSKGFRNPQETGQADIVFLGDSYTEAGNIPEKESFVAGVARQTRCTVRNLGIAGYAPPGELGILKQFGLAYSPRTVIWQISESNDLTDTVAFAKWVQDGRPALTTSVEGYPTHFEAWQRRSPSQHLFELLRQPRPWPLAGTFRDSIGLSHEVRFLPVLPGADNSNISPVGHPGWPTMTSALREGAKILKDRGIELIVVLIPMKVRVMAEHTAFHELVLNLVGGGQERLQGHLPSDWDLPVEQRLAFHLEQLCQAEGVRFIDAEFKLKEITGKGELAYLPMDTHLSPDGHRIIEGLIIDALKYQTCSSAPPN